jgi:histidyl-tRNA synthetase
LIDCNLNNDSIDQIVKLCTENEFDIKPLLDEYADTTKDYSFTELLNLIEKSEYNKFIKVSPTLVRGLAYYDGIVFEIFDKKTIDNKNTNNIDILNRSIFGGGRYNGLAEIFGIKDMLAVGFAPGDETTKIFLENNNLLHLECNKNRYYLPILDPNLFKDIALLGKKLRSINYVVINGTHIQSIQKALEYANKNKYTHVIIYGIDEQKQQIYKIKDLNTGRETQYKFQPST